MSRQRRWLYRPENLPRLWAVQVIILLLALLPEFFVDHHPHFTEKGFELDASPGFYAWYGFLTCAAMVVGAKVVGVFLKRREDYYDE